MEKINFRLTLSIAKDSKHPHWEEILEAYIKEAIIEYVGCQSEEHPDSLVEIKDVSLETLDKSHVVKYGIKIDGVPQMYEFYEKSQADDMVDKLERNEGIQPELIEVYPIAQLTIKEVKSSE